MANWERPLSDYEPDYPKKYSRDSIKFGSIDELYQACQEKFDKAKNRSHTPGKDQPLSQIIRVKTGEVLGEYARGKEFDLAAMDILKREDFALYCATIVSEPIASAFIPTKSHPYGQIYWDYLFKRLKRRMPQEGYKVTEVSSDQKIMDGLQQETDQSQPENAADARGRILRSIVQRRGQKRFRNHLLNAYDGRCAVTNCDVEDALEACHISPYQGEQTNGVTNGLLLRADIHTLFDLKLIAIHEDTGKVLITQSLKKTTYKSLATRYLNMPAEESDGPDRDALARHREEANL